MRPDEYNDSGKDIEFEDALVLCGVGMYNALMLVTCGLFILAVMLDIFGFSVMLASIACDMGLTTSQQGFLSAVPLIGIMLSYAWGLSADIKGRRFTLLLAMPISAVINLIAALAPTFSSLVFMKFLSSCFTSSANSAAYVLMGESVSRSQRSRFMFMLATASMLSQLVAALFALPILQQTFRLQIPWLGVTYQPWRLLMHVLTLPAIIGSILMLFLKESPKFVLSKGQHEDAIDILKTIYKWNKMSGKISSYPVISIYLENTETTSPAAGTSFLRNIWDHTAPLFKPPLLKNSLKLYYILMTAYMTSTGFTVWVPSLVNAYFNGDDHRGEIFCQVASTAVSENSNQTNINCDNTVQPSTLYAVMVYSGACGFTNMSLSFIVGSLGKKKTTLLVFLISITSGVILIFVRIPYMSIACFYLFLYVANILGNMNTYLVELNPTHLRGMALCFSTVVTRGFGFISVQVIATWLSGHCGPMLLGYIALVVSGFVTSVFLPPDSKQKNTTMAVNKKNDDHDRNI